MVWKLNQRRLKSVFNIYVRILRKPLKILQPLKNVFYNRFNLLSTKHRMKPTNFEPTRTSENFHWRQHYTHSACENNSHYNSVDGKAYLVSECETEIIFVWLHNTKQAPDPEHKPVSLQSAPPSPQAPQTSILCMWQRKLLMWTINRESLNT